MDGGFRADRLRELLVAVDPKPGRQNRLAKALGVGRQTVSGWIRGQGRPSGQRLVDVAAYVGTTAEDLLPPQPRTAAGQ